MVDTPTGYSVTVQDVYLRRTTSPPIEAFPIGPEPGQLHIIDGTTYRARVTPVNQIAVVDWIAQPQPVTPDQISARIDMLKTEIGRLLGND